MKRFSDTELIPKLDLEGDGEYWTDIDTDWLKDLALKAHKEKRPLVFEIKGGEVYEDFSFLFEGLNDLPDNQD